MNTISMHDDCTTPTRNPGGIFASMQGERSGEGGPAAEPPGVNQAGWYPDPVGDHDLRYHNGVRWTGDVAIDGQRFVAPLVPPPVVRRRTGTVALVTGLIAITISWIPFIGVIGAVLALVAIVTGVQGRRDPQTRGSATAGIAIGSTALLLAVGSIWLSVALWRGFVEFSEPGRHDAVLTECGEIDDVTRATGTITNLESDERSYVITVEFEPDRSRAVEVDDVAPGDTRDFVVEEDLRFDDLECSIIDVTGPYPFGLSLDS
jgi:hypothetical protein